MLLGINIGWNDTPTIFVLEKDLALPSQATFFRQIQKINGRVT
jgi:hypothetical protein